MSKSSEKVKVWRKSTKDRIIKAMGGSCALCGYNKCSAALALHHLDPSQKDFSLGAIRASIKSWNSIVIELKKCILVCHNCHSEIHNGIAAIPEQYAKFNSEYEDYYLLKDKKFSNCLICNARISTYNKYCSYSCAGKSKYKIDWDSIDLKEELKYKPITKLAEEIGCSDGAIHKRLKKMGYK